MATLTTAGQTQDRKKKKGKEKKNKNIKTLDFLCFQSSNAMGKAALTPPLIHRYTGNLTEKIKDFNGEKNHGLTSLKTEEEKIGNRYHICDKTTKFV